MDNSAKDCLADGPGFEPQTEQVLFKTNPFQTNLTTDPSAQCQFVLHQRPYEARVALPKCERCIRRRNRSIAKYQAWWEAITDREPTPELQ